MRHFATHPALPFLLALNTVSLTASQPESIDTLAMTLNVLIVDDEENIRRFLRRRLEQWHYSVREADSASQALELMQATPADIAVIDIGLPGRNGLCLAEQIHERWSKTAIVMATGADDLTSIQKSRKIGAVDYVLKPFDREMLRQALARATLAAGG